VRCGQCAAVDALGDATAVVARLLPGPRADVGQLVAQAASTGEQRRRLAAHLRAQPTPWSRVPPAARRLSFA
jgi:hypothetical protein